MNKSLEPLLFLKSALIYRHSFYNITKVLGFFKNADAFIFLVFAASAKNNPHYVNAENQSKWHYQSFAQIYSLRIHFEGTGQNEVCFHCHILTHATLYRKAPRCVLNTFIHSKHNLSSLFVSLLGEGWIYSLPIYLMLMKEWIKSNHINHIKGLLCNVRNGTHHERMHTPTKADFHTIS